MVLNGLAELRCEAAAEEDVTADEGAPAKGLGWTGIGPPMQVGAGYVTREGGDGQSLDSPGRWPQALPKLPDMACCFISLLVFLGRCGVAGSPHIIGSRARQRVSF